ncbi:MAG: hypothetical protein WCF65_02035 [Parachlamydiaceae bacterium]
MPLKGLVNGHSNELLDLLFAPKSGGTSTEAPIFRFFPGYAPIFESLEVNDLYRLFKHLTLEDSAVNEKLGKTEFLKQHYLSFIPLLVKLAKEPEYRDVVAQFISKKNSAGESFLDRVESFQIITILAEDTEYQDLVFEYLSKKSPPPEEKSFLAQNAVQFMPTIIKLAEQECNHETLKELLSAPFGKDKKTPLHDLKFLHQAQPLVNLLGGKVWLQSVQDALGLNPLESVEMKIEFLKSPKNQMMNFKVISREEYIRRMGVLENWVKKTWAVVKQRYVKDETKIKEMAIKRIVIIKSEVEKKRSEIEKRGETQFYEDNLFKLAFGSNPSPEEMKAARDSKLSPEEITAAFNSKLSPEEIKDELDSKIFINSFELKVGAVIKQYSPIEIEPALNGMFEKIGTMSSYGVSDEDIKKSYWQILGDFECIKGLLEERGDIEATTSRLIAMVRPNMEQRCAVGNRTEFSQAKKVLLEMKISDANKIMNDARKQIKEAEESIGGSKRDRVMAEAGELIKQAQKMKDEVRKIGGLALQELEDSTQLTEEDRVRLITVPVAREILEGFVNNIAATFIRNCAVPVTNQVHCIDAFLSAAGFIDFKPDRWAMGLDLEKARSYILGEFKKDGVTKFVSDFQSNNVISDEDYQRSILSYVEMPPQDFDVNFRENNGTITNYHKQIELAKAKEKLLKSDIEKKLTEKVPVEAVSVLGLFHGLGQTSLAPLMESKDMPYDTKKGLVDNVLVYGKNLLINRYKQVKAAVESPGDRNELLTPYLIKWEDTDQGKQLFSTEGIEPQKKRGILGERADFQRTVEALRMMIQCAQSFEVEVIKNKGITDESKQREIFKLRVEYDKRIMEISKEIPKKVNVEKSSPGSVVEDELIECYGVNVLADYKLPSAALQNARTSNYAYRFRGNLKAKFVELLVRIGVIERTEHPWVETPQSHIGGVPPSESTA